MIQRVQQKREAKNHPEDQRSVRELPVCSFHRSKNIAAGDECKAMSCAPMTCRSRFTAYPDIDSLWKGGRPSESDQVVTRIEMSSAATSTTLWDQRLLCFRCLRPHRVAVHSQTRRTRR